MKDTSPSGYRTLSPGVRMRVLRQHDGGGMTFLIHMERGARAVRHEHPGGEETYLLSGALRIVDRVDARGESAPEASLRPGEYFFAPPGERHEGVAEEEATFLVVAPGGVARV